MTALVVRVSGSAGGAGAFVAASRTTAGGRYRLAATPERVVCTCPGYANRHACWHVGVVAAELAREQRQASLEGSTEPSRSQQRAARHASAERLEDIASEFGL